MAQTTAPMGTTVVLNAYIIIPLVAISGLALTVLTVAMYLDRLHRLKETFTPLTTFPDPPESNKARKIIEDSVTIHTFGAMDFSSSQSRMHSTRPHSWDAYVDREVNRLRMSQHSKAPPVRPAVDETRSDEPWPQYIPRGISDGRVTFRSHGKRLLAEYSQLDREMLFKYVSYLQNPSPKSSSLGKELRPLLELKGSDSGSAELVVDQRSPLWKRLWLLLWTREGAFGRGPLLVVEHVVGVLVGIAYTMLQRLFLVSRRAEYTPGVEIDVDADVNTSEQSVDAALELALKVDLDHVAQLLEDSGLSGHGKEVSVRKVPTYSRRRGANVLLAAQNSISGNDGAADEYFELFGTNWHGSLHTGAGPRVFEFASPADARTFHAKLASVVTGR